MTLLGPKVVAARAVGELARRAGLAPSRFHERFLAEAGESPARWVARRRLELARARLRAGEPVTRIALDLGFASSQHFATAFRRVYGVAPSAWAKRAAAVAGLLS